MKFGDCLGPAQLEHSHVQRPMVERNMYQWVRPGIIFASMSFCIAPHVSPSTGGPEGSKLRR